LANAGGDRRRWLPCLASREGWRGFDAIVAAGTQRIYRQCHRWTGAGIWMPSSTSDDPPSNPHTMEPAQQTLAIHATWLRSTANLGEDSEISTLVPFNVNMLIVLRRCSR
jgi:hypothetical protein